MDAPKWWLSQYFDMACRDFAMAVYTARVATRVQNGDEWHDTPGLKGGTTPTQSIRGINPDFSWQNKSRVHCLKNTFILLMVWGGKGDFFYNKP